MFGRKIMKIQGLDKFRKTLKEAREALSALDGILDSVEFTYDDPASIESAIQAVDHAIDSRLRHLNSNPMVASMVEQTKQHFRQRIIDKAAAARLSRQDS